MRLIFMIHVLCQLSDDQIIQNEVDGAHIMYAIYKKYKHNA
jgi:hypothetical protein